MVEPLENRQALKRLGELTEKLQPPVPLDGEPELFELENGMAILWKMWRADDDHASVLRATNAAGSVFPAHKHDVHEILVFTTGTAEITLGDESRMVVMAPGCFHATPGMLHSLKYLENTELIAIMIPNDPELWS